MSESSSAPAAIGATSTEGRAMNKPVDRSRDISQPLDRLGPDETLKASSDQLRGTIEQSLSDPITGAVAASDNKLMKFHGIYMQDDRDLRDERRRQKLEPAYQFMIRVRLAGGVCTPEQWLRLDEIARTRANGTLRLTTRQTFQFHGVLKGGLKPAIQGMHAALLDTIAACGDDARGVMCSVNPHLSEVHAEVYRIAKQTSDAAIPRMPAWHEIWLGRERVASSGPEEPFYGKQYMPRKFKIGFALPPSNDIDVYTQDLGFIAVAGPDGLEGFNVSVGGGMGRTDNEPKTYPRLADVIGFVPKDRVVDTALAVMSVQRDYGDRVDRAHARFKYTIDDKGLDWIRAEIEERIGFPFGEARPFEFTSNTDELGWVTGDDGKHHFGLFIQSGRVANGDGCALLDGLRAIAGVHEGEFRLTPNQNLVIANVAPARRAQIEALLERHGLAGAGAGSALRRHSIACVALPTCALAMAEAERYLPSLITKLERVLAENGLADDAITIRMSGCPNGCSRPYVAEIGFTGRAPGKYNVYLGGGFHGQRLNRPYLENVGEDRILNELAGIVSRYAREREAGERFGDFTIRAGYVRAVTSGPDFNA
jgi:sulfite reductase (NADPH) hemoprotein beta-component